MATYSFNEALDRTLDYARLYLGDTDVSEGGAHAWLPDETINGAITKHGWTNGMIALVTGLMTRAGSMPTTWAEGNGVVIKMEDQLEAWRALLNNLKNGTVPDPTANVIVTESVSVSSGYVLGRANF